MKKTVAAVVVTYNRKELLHACIDALRMQTAAARMDILVIDNASTDGTGESLKPLIEQGVIVYRNTGANLGGAGGFCRGMREAAERGYEFVWVMDDDCLPEPEALSALLEYDGANRGGYGFLSSLVLWKDGTPCRMNVPRRTLTRPVKSFQAEEISVVMASFVSLFVPVAVLREVGLPIAAFYLWTDDWEFTRRISRRYPCFLLTGSRVRHLSAANRGADLSREVPERLPRYRFLYRNDVVLYRHEGIRGVAYEAVRLTGHALRILRHSKDKKQRLKILVRGTREGLSFFPQISYPGRPIRVLEAFGEPLSYGGEEALVSSFLSRMNRDGIAVDFLTPYYCDNEAVVRKAEEVGGQVYALGLPFRPGKSRRPEIPALRAFLKEHDYDVIHIHSGSTSMLAIYAKLAAKAGIQRIIVHAHCAGRANLKHSAVKAVTRFPLLRYPTHYLACSNAAGRWMLPNKAFEKRLKVIGNGIDTARFRYDPEVRARVRAQLDIPEAVRVIGCVGRLTPSKNQAYLFPLLRELSAECDCRLLLVGDGEAMKALEEEAERCGIRDRVIFAGATERPEAFYQAMDVFALPTLFEGFSLVALEAQANGLPVLLSDLGDRSTAMTSLIRYLPLDNPAAWLMALREAKRERVYAEEKEYDIGAVAAEIRKLYREE